MKIWVGSFVLVSFLLSILRSSNGSVNEKKILCYYSNQASGGSQMIHKPEDIDTNLCTHIIYSYANLNVDRLISHGNIWQESLYKRATALRNKGTKVLLSMYGADYKTSGVNSQLLTNPDARKNFTQHVVGYIKEKNFDGLDLDMEYPGCWPKSCGPHRSKDKEGFAELVKELSEAFKPHGLILSATVGATKKIIDNSYDVPELVKYLEWFALKALDFHTYDDDRTGPTAPLYSPDNLSVDFAVNYFLEKGVPSEKLILGVPGYGRTYSLRDPKNNGFNASTDGNGKGIAGEADVYTYYEICENTKKTDDFKWTPVHDPTLGSYAYQGYYWVSFDDVEDVRAKGKYIREKNLGGGMFWKLDSDDFKNKCGCGEYPLLTTLNQEVRGIEGSKITNCT